MEKRTLRQPAAIGLVALLALALGTGGSLAQEKLKTPEPGVPELFTLEGQFVRVTYNNEGYVSLGYRMANMSAGEEWMLLQIGVTVRRDAKSQTLKRGALSLETPDHKSLILASQKEYMEADLRALDMQTANVVHDSVNYFPPDATQPCKIGFFKDISRGRGVSFD